MRRLESKYILAQPARRPLRIFASDPMLARTPGNRTTIEVPNEQLRPGPIGARLEVIDYDGVQKCFYPPVNLDDPKILMQGGLEPSESDPRFHQQMVYAVAMRTLESFERALGRRLAFWHSATKTRLRLFPHAFHGANAFYDPTLNAILFGYFRADRQDPGPNLPGQTVFTCLSHDIIVHELSHAVTDRLRRHFREPTNPDVLAFHEGFSDIVALFQHFTYQEFLRDQIQKTRGDIREGQILVDLARQFGYATGAGRALRSAIGDKDQKQLSPSIVEVHERGAILVAAVFDAFFATYQKRTRDLIRIATGGTGVLPEGDLHPDLVNRIAAEASRTAQSVLTICIRAFDYLPPVDVTFGDYLRALVTADYELEPGDESGLRSALIEAFRARAIYPEDVVSLAEESLIWSDAPKDLPLLDPEGAWLAREMYLWAKASRQDPSQESRGEEDTLISERSVLGKKESRSGWAKCLHDYALAAAEDKIPNAQRLLLDRSKPVQVGGFHITFRASPVGQLLTEVVVQLLQQDESKKKVLGGVPLRGGTTVVAGIDGRIRYVIAKPLPSTEDDPRLARQIAYLEATDMADARMAYGDTRYINERSKLRMRIAALHQGVGS